MYTSIEAIIFYILVVDALIANIIAWLGAKWYLEHFQIMSRVFPMSKAWTGLYLVLVLFIGYLIFY